MMGWWSEDLSWWQMSASFNLKDADEARGVEIKKRSIRVSQGRSSYLYRVNAEVQECLTRYVSTAKWRSCTKAVSQLHELRVTLLESSRLNWTLKSPPRI